MRNEAMGKRSASEMSSNFESNVGDPMDIDAMVPQRASLLTIQSRPSPFGNETGALPIGEFEPLTSNPQESALRSARVLVVGAGGLGCEILKDVALSGILHIDVIDLDTIDVTNLNRQFLFREKDVGSSKAQVAANFINTKFPHVTVTAHYGKIQDKDSTFYASFNCILSGLDNVEARRWLNATVCGLVELDRDGDPDPSTIVPIIDGGTEGFSGQARVILPRITSCFECSLDAFPPQTSYPLCTIAETPRRPEHCIAYAYVLQWPKEFPNRKLDTDSPEDMKWVYERALERAKSFDIKGVTYMLTMGVVKNIIPAVASTNAIVAAACVHECTKLLAYYSQSLNTYMMYMGTTGVYSHTFVYERKEDCPVCTEAVRAMSLSKSYTLNELVHSLKNGDLKLQSPSIASSSKTLYMPNPPALEKATRPNLDKALSLLLLAGEPLTITDPAIQGLSLRLSVTFEE